MHLRYVLLEEERENLFIHWPPFPFGQTWSHEFYLPHSSRVPVGSPCRAIPCSFRRENQRHPEKNWDEVLSGYTEGKPVKASWNWSLPQQPEQMTIPRGSTDIHKQILVLYFTEVLNVWVKSCFCLRITSPSIHLEGEQWHCSLYLWSRMKKLCDGKASSPVLALPPTQVT